MLFNRKRAEMLIEKRGFDAIVASSPENVLYATGYECVTHWINKGFQLYALFSPASQPDASLIAPSLELDAIVDGDVWVEDVYLFSDFKRGRADPALIDAVSRKAIALAERSHQAVSALDGLVAAIEARGLQNGRIGIDESGFTPPAMEALRKRLPNCDIVYSSGLWWEIRMVKTDEEIRRMARATEISEEAILSTYQLIAPGVSERTLVQHYHEAIAVRGGRPSFCVIGSGSRSSYPHALVSDRKIQDGDIVRYDIGCTYEYYQSDNARAVVLGKPSDEQERIWNVLCEGVDAAVAQIKPGAHAEALFEVAMAPARKLGLDNFERFHCGHGIGISVYDPPIITGADPSKSAFLMPDIRDGLLEGMAINIEVGYYLQGHIGFLCEDTVIVTSNGCRVLTRNSKSLDLETFLKAA